MRIGASRRRRPRVMPVMLENLEERRVLALGEACAAWLGEPSSEAASAVSGVFVSTVEDAAEGEGEDWLVVGGTLPAGEQSWTAAEGPYHVTSDLRVPANATLSIEPGTQIYVDEGLEIIVVGTLIARGTADQRIIFSSPPNAPWVPDRPHNVQGLPDGPPRWDGIHFQNSASRSNQISYADIAYAQSDNGSVGVISSRAVLDHLSFAGTHLRMVYASNASLVVSDSTFPDMFVGNERPAQLGLDNVSEQIKIVGTPPADGELIIRGNHFGTNRGHNDVIDGDSGRRPGPILQILDNVFTGTGDELLDLGGDVYVAGNLFQNVAKDPDNLDARFSNAISTGDGGATAMVVVARNVFFNVDHAMHLRGGNRAIFEQNTFVQVHPPGKGLGSALALYANVGAEVPAAGAALRGNLFADVPLVFGNPDQPNGHSSVLTFADNLVTPTLAQTTVGQRPGTLLDLFPQNQVGTPQFVDFAQLDFRLAPGSPGIGAGPQGRDVGADVAAGVWVSGAPMGVTTATTAQLTIGGPGIFSYRYRVNGGEWSAELPVGNGVELNGLTRTSQLQLENLGVGAYVVELQGRDFAGQWQDEIVSSRPWYVTTLRGDVTADGVIGAADVDRVCAGTREDRISPELDLNQDGATTVDDYDVLVREILGTGPGDANLDRIFDSSDLVATFQAGHYEVDDGSAVGWGEGDWNCDTRFNTTDLVAAFQQGTYQG